VFYICEGTSGVELAGAAVEAFKEAFHDCDEHDYVDSEACSKFLLGAVEEIAVKLRENVRVSVLMVVSDGHNLWGASIGGLAGYVTRSGAVIEFNLDAVITSDQPSAEEVVGFSFDLQPGDCAILASKQLFDLVGHWEAIKVTAGGGSPSASAQALVDLARSIQPTTQPQSIAAMVLQL
jgi:hypothetical protein